MIRSRRTRAAFAAALLVVGLGACSSGGDSDSADTTEKTTTTAGKTTTTEETTTTAAGADEDAAMARAEAANITIDDLPDGWTAEPADGGGENVFDTCGDVNLDEVTVAKARSDQFSLDNGDGTSLSLSTTSGVLTSEEDATALVTQMGESDFADCASDALVKAVGAPNMEGSLSAADPSDLPDLGDQMAALSGTYTIPAPSGTTTTTINVLVVGIRTDDLVTTVSASAVGTDGDSDLLQSVLETVAERQAA